MPLLHVFVILGTRFESSLSTVDAFHCDVPDFSNTPLANVTTFARGLDYFLADTPTLSLATPSGLESLLAGCHDVDGHDELDSYIVKETVQGLRFQVDCQPSVSLGRLTYNGAYPAPAGTTDLSIRVLSTMCDGDFCMTRASLDTFGADASTSKCVLSTQGISVTGMATFKRVGKGARTCSVFVADPESISDADPNYTRVWTESLATLKEATGRWPSSSWMGGLAYELAMDPPFNGSITTVDAEHVAKRLIAGLHRLVGSTYTAGVQSDCTGAGILGAGIIIIPGLSRTVAIAFSVLAITIALHTVTSSRDIQLTVGIRNYRRAISALSDPLRFAILLDRTDAAASFAGQNVAIGGDCDVPGLTGHACISTIDRIDPFNQAKNYL
ncbi:hypothetical protein HDU89_000468 [Geranomyces variabilis]|nr:hypothetical protein HDU89_000468 [Geranomyces variabilis]